MGIMSFEDGIQVAQAITHFPCNGRIGEVIKNGLVVFVDQYDHALVMARIRSTEHFAQASGNITVIGTA